MMAVVPEPTSAGDAKKPTVSLEGERSIGLPAGARNAGGTEDIGAVDSIVANDVLRMAERSCGRSR